MANKQAGSLMKNLYLSRYAYPETLINEPVAAELDAIVTIPCFKEENLIESLESLKNCEREGLSIEVIILINEANNATNDITSINTKAFEEALLWAKTHSEPAFKVFPLYINDLKPKHAGVGLARKIAMDEAVRRFESISKPDGIIICYDADSRCDSNYLQSVIAYFQDHPKCPGASIYFEHPLEGYYPDEIYEAIIDYELFLRYYVNGLRYAGFPYAYETIGSSMAVRSNAYQKQGGMNKRKAGEDFYFLHKIIPLGQFGEINNTKVIPSPRKSDRVPFGTGKAVNEWLKSKNLDTYHPQIFEELKGFIYHVPGFFNNSNIEAIIESFPASIKAFLYEKEFTKNLARINKNAASDETFLKQFYQWFDGFMVLKYVHFARDHYHSNIPIREAAKKLLSMQGLEPADNSKDLLLQYRKHDSAFS
ncbi:glycosyltransferase family 2 protein [Fulvivirga maritima]|uniref:glycosyltransferase n=1 Tax=Fulvivirga maritima TaxID=2904247 RepID=UPI001F238AB5|nr:glycosyltransferase family 2 protein [Fulvivirga maritima]UII25620.1 glycosyltransferase family 2 protein [Fulvivirga maritima]